MTIAVFAVQLVGGGPRRRAARSSQTKPKTEAVKESEIQEKVTTNSTTSAHSSGVTTPTSTTPYISRAP